MMAKLTDTLPEGERWMYEVKWDGYRALLLKNGDRVRLVSRNDNDLTSTYPIVEAAGKKLKAAAAILDGEIVALDPHGKPSFQALQHRAAHRNHAIVFYAFDLLHLNGHDLRRMPLEERTKQLPEVAKGSGILVSERRTQRRVGQAKAGEAAGICDRRLSTRAEWRRCTIGRLLRR
jgi:bifunctional non-homologous end joining protein LigD